MDTNMSRRDLLKFGAVATTAAVGVSMLGCSTNSAAADGAADVTKAATGTATVTMEEATSQNILNVEKTVPNFAYIPDIDYKQTITKNSYSTMKMDIIAPSSDKPLPCILYINGGGFTRSSPAGHLWERMYLAEQGFVVASIQHSVVPAAKFPQPLLDCKDAVRFLRANAETYNIDKDRIAAMGNSAGGYFATMLGVTADIAKFDEGAQNASESCGVSAVVDFYGVSDLTIIGAGLPDGLEEGHDSPATTEALMINGTAFGDNKGASVFDTPEKAAEASPFTYIDSNDPPFLIFQGTADTLVSPVATAELQVKLEEAGVKATRYVVPEAKHGDPVFSQPEVMDLVVDFLNESMPAKQG